MSFRGRGEFLPHAVDEKFSVCRLFEPVIEELYPSFRMLRAIVIRMISEVPS
jgi:hypothetical protein